MKEKKNGLVTAAEGWRSPAWGSVQLLPGLAAWPWAKHNLPMPKFPPL